MIVFYFSDHHPITLGTQVPPWGAQVPPTRGLWGPRGVPSAPRVLPRRAPGPQSPPWDTEDPKKFSHVPLDPPYCEKATKNICFKLFCVVPVAPKRTPGAPPDRPWAPQAPPKDPPMTPEGPPRDTKDPPMTPWDPSGDPCGHKAPSQGPQGCQSPLLCPPGSTILRKIFKLY